MNNKDELKCTWLLEELLKAGYVELFNYEGEVYAINLCGEAIKHRKFPFINLARKDTIYLPMLSHLITGERESISIAQLLGIVEWGKVKVDTPVIMHNSKGDYYAHFCKYENGKIYIYQSGITSWTARNYEDDCTYCVPEDSKVYLAPERLEK